MTSIAAACADRAWTSNPTHVIVPGMAGPPHSSGVSPSHSPARQIPARSVRPLTLAVNPARADPRQGSRHPACRPHAPSLVAD
jgi:hypothetical protein